MDSDIRYAKSLGVNDCLLKPITTKDLLAAIQGGLQSAQLILRALEYQTAHKYSLFSINGYELRIDFNQNRVWCNQDELPLSNREVLALRRLAQTPGKVVAITELVNVTHGIETDNIEAGVIIRPLIRDIRNKLKQVVGLEDGSLFLQNVRGRGYMLTHLQREN
ncbi:MAG: response regulator transcription factor [Chloroflexi bacterium]|nr:response regulator transcription factor [Chloroflexota bacterium]